MMAAGALKMMLSTGLILIAIKTNANELARKLEITLPYINVRLVG